MSRRFAEIVFTPTVQALQQQAGSRDAYARMQSDGTGTDALGPREAGFLAAADSFYLASVGETGWPYVQHRGGPAGFLKVLSPSQIGFADFRGNVQFVSAGNTRRDDRVALIVMDYPRRQRLKLLGHLHFVPIAQADPDLVRRVELDGYRARVERVALIDVEGFDWNCPQHITPRYTAAQVETAVATLRAQVAALEDEVKRLRAGAGAAG